MKHKTLELQVKKYLGEALEQDPKLNSLLQDFLRVVSSTYQDLEKKSLELAPAQSAALVTNAKMSELGKMAGGIAHEINTPLSTILLLSEALCRKAESKCEIEDVQNLQRIMTTTKRIATIVKGLRTYSRDGSGDAFKPADSTQLVQQVLALCRERFKYAEVELIIEAREGISFLCRETQISQLLLNILNNAFDAIQNAPKRWVKVQVRDLDTHLEIAISDSGPGIPIDIQDKIMLPFFTTKPVGSGTGLGLSISSSIAGDHGGYLALDRESPNTRFVVNLAKDPGKLVDKIR